MQIVPIIKHGNFYLNSCEFTVELPAGSFQLETLKDPEKEKRLKELCDDFFGKDIKINIINGTK